MFVSRNSANAEGLANVAAQYSLEPTLFDSGRITSLNFFGAHFCPCLPFFEDFIALLCQEMVHLLPISRSSLRVRETTIQMGTN